MLLHLSSRRSYWYCNHCRLEMPNPPARLNHKERSLNPDSSLETALAPLKSHQPAAMV